MKQMTDVYFNVMDFGAVGDGVQDDTQALQKCFDTAQQHGGTAFLPCGRYLVTETLLFGKNENGDRPFSIVGEGRGNSRSIIVKFTDGDIAQTATCGKLEISQLGFAHKGSSGRCLYLDREMGYGVYDCSFSNVAGNKSDILCFNGSYTDIVNSSFGNSEPDAYAIRCTTVGKKLNINSNIFECRIHGKGKGLIVDSAPNNRPEGLKVSRNMFLNTGKEQITVRTILHIDISNNMLDQCSDTTLLIDPEGMGVCGAYILGNYISPAQNRKNGVAIKVVENDVFVLTINVSNNMIAYTGYGLIAGKNARQVLIANNAFNDVAKDGICLTDSRGSIVNANTFWMVEGEACVNSYSLGALDTPVIENNTNCRI